MTQNQAKGLGESFVLKKIPIREISFQYWEKWCAQKAGNKKAPGRWSGQELDYNPINL
jgi:hypothetical protein